MLSFHNDKEKSTLRIFFQFVAIALVFLCSACGTPVPTNEEQVRVLSSPMPQEYFYDDLETYKKEHAAALQADKNFLWWKTFASEDLNALEEIALKENYDILSAYARMKQAAADANIAESEFFPLITLGASGAKNLVKQKMKRRDIPQALLLNAIV